MFYETVYGSNSSFFASLFHLSPNNEFCSMFVPRKMAKSWENRLRLSYGTQQAEQFVENNQSCTKLKFSFFTNQRKFTDNKEFKTVSASLRLFMTIIILLFLELSYDLPSLSFPVQISSKFVTGKILEKPELFQFTAWKVEKTIIESLQFNSKELHSLTIWKASLVVTSRNLKSAFKKYR